MVRRNQSGFSPADHCDIQLSLKVHIIHPAISEDISDLLILRGIKDFLDKLETLSITENILKLFQNFPNQRVTHCLNERFFICINNLLYRLNVRGRDHFATSETFAPQYH